MRLSSSCLNKSKGISYVEVLVAMGLLVILLAGALPMLQQAGRNMQFAQSHYEGHLLAQSMAIHIRMGLENGQSPEHIGATFAHQHGVDGYQVWLLGQSPAQFGTGESITVDMPINQLLPHQHLVVVAILNVDGDMIGRGVSIKSNPSVMGGPDNG